MDSQIEQITPVECRVRVTVPWTTVGPRLDTKLRTLGQKARVPGFRPGKVPARVLEKMFGKSARQELANELFQETFQTAMSTHEANPLTQPVLESSALEKDADFVYAARFEIAPKIEPKDYKGVPVRRRPATVDEAKVEAELAKKQEEFTEIRPIEREGDDARTTTRDGDVWTVDIDGKIGDEPLSRKDLEITLGKPDTEVVPGLGAEIAKFDLAMVGKSREVVFVPPSERVKPQFRDKPVKLVIAVRDVRETVVPELDDEFARDTGEAETLEELKEQIRAKVSEEDTDVAEREARQRLVEALLERNEFDPAPSMVTREVQAQVDMFKRQLAQQGMTLQQIGSNEAQMAANMRPQATFNVKAFLLLEAIRKAEGIEVPEEELEEEVKQMAEAQGQNPARLRATMEKNNQLLLLRAQMREERVLDFLMGASEVTEAPDPVETNDDAAGEGEPTPESA
ncbi:Cell division trigger factor [Enhygromyxa salina]|uniref:Trigger factor n=1 Tax=Enhygromyxa salina TaxID=215803 RepID=A0A0C1ZLB1_9BACT|nr:trigger factor [Enhygromyxa salina]KIG18324.1 Cell division trigger factor [Enhygromyxa salina]